MPRPAPYVEHRPDVVAENPIVDALSTISHQLDDTPVDPILHAVAAAQITAAIRMLRLEVAELADAVRELNRPRKGRR